MEEFTPEEEELFQRLYDNWKKCIEPLTPVERELYTLWFFSGLWNGPMERPGITTPPYKIKSSSQEDGA